MLLAAHLAGLAFSTTGLGTAHAIGHALSARYGTPHGVALACVLPSVCAANLECREAETARLADALGGVACRKPSRSCRIEIGLRPTLVEFGVAPEDLPDIADAALADEVIRNAPTDSRPREELVRLLDGV